MAIYIYIPHMAMRGIAKLSVQLRSEAMLHSPIMIEGLATTCLAIKNIFKFLLENRKVSSLSVADVWPP